MYSSDRSPLDAALGRGRASGSEHDRERFQPVALPALAAAVHINAAAARADRDKRAAKRVAPMIHEDEPTA